MFVSVIHDCAVYWTVIDAPFKNAVSICSVTRNEIERRYFVDRPFCQIVRKFAMYFSVGSMSVFKIDTKILHISLASILIGYFVPVCYIICDDRRPQISRAILRFFQRYFDMFICCIYRNSLPSRMMLSLVSASQRTSPACWSWRLITLIWSHTLVRHFLHHHCHHLLLLLSSTPGSKLIFSTNSFLHSSSTFPLTGLIPRTPAVFFHVGFNSGIVC